MSIYAQKKPTINIWLDDKIDEKDIQEICYGIEEEGIPFSVAYKSSNHNAVTLSYQAALESDLLVGIGGTATEFVLHYKHLPTERFLYRLNRKQETTPRELRILGSNAAKLVKGEPFIVSSVFEKSF
ncbi:PduH protein [Granulicatella sp. zg-ZJ]|uniref:glycerol dehydratase reactivase beta/small subunit family protein n=1 Tax=unclassified Granulicatella TaxID=2630493 RepID=UPI0013C26476|nr:MULTISPECIES: glycerol dehydratase reactivase beta/small subunit family protein [unclassified Granulicatella]MBS4749723.1 glycerol dehydratase reactivase beta/small subunit family protein [Carnobacteriaceae bacterium zg-ZUI78]NEW61852.1 PduH protein [Granulicatella sp. zg-ZJ]NEW65926.1 PduH protein [Granulicatella sp. zg-84]QMI85153.1 glycerol dehydratase reactivase beta/small subunit family protein [Carnobacteriaceae bacterium zg-84]